VQADALGEGLREVTARTVVGQQAVTAWSFDRRREGPRSGDLDLQLVACTEAGCLGVLLERVEVLAEQRPGPSVVDAWRVGEPPTGGLQVEPEVGDDRQGTSGHPCRGSPRGQLGQVWELRQLAEDEAHRLVDVDARERTDTRRPHAGARLALTSLTRLHAATLCAGPIRVPRGSEPTP
jgi:hypothetical protein